MHVEAFESSQSGCPARGAAWSTGRNILHLNPVLKLKHKKLCDLVNKI